VEQAQQRRDGAASARTLIASPVSDAYRRGETLDELHRRFTEHGYVKLPGLLADGALDVLHREIGALEARARAHDFVMPGPDTPRVLSVLGATSLLADSRAAILYVHFEIVRVIAGVTGEDVRACGHEEELMVCNLLLSEGSTHGWHLDDPPYALVIVLEAPAPGGGGELEYISDWAGTCERLGHRAGGPAAPAVAAARAEGLIATVDHRPGDAYLLRADRCMHRVTTLHEPGTRRVALNFAYETTTPVAYGDSATALYGQTSCS
jgi:hypothetical protein